MNLRKIIAATLLLSLLGCASAPELLTQQFVDPPNNNLSTLVLYRENAMPTKIYARVVVDGVMKAYLPDGRVTWIQVLPGRHQVKAEFPSISGVTSAELTHEFSAGETYYIRYEGGAPKPGVPIIAPGGILVGSMGGGGSYWNRLVVVPKNQAEATARRLLYVSARSN